MKAKFGIRLLNGKYIVINSKTGDIFIKQKISRNEHLIQNVRAGAFSGDWTMPEFDFPVYSISIRAFYLYSYFTIKKYFISFGNLLPYNFKLNRIKKYSPKKIKDTCSFVALSLAKAPECFLYSLTLFRMLCDYGWYSNFNIGISIYPFASHAWVEYNGKPLSDSEDNVKCWTKLITINPKKFN